MNVHLDAILHPGRVVAVAILLGVVWSTLVEGCTQIEIMAPSGELVVANAVEADDKITGVGMTYSVTPRGVQHGGNPSSCMSFTTKYGENCVGCPPTAIPNLYFSPSALLWYVNVEVNHTLTSCRYSLAQGSFGGMSEVGLSINEHTLDLAVFQTPDPSMPTLCKDDLQSWILGMHSTVAEVIAGLQSVRVVGSRGNQYGVQDTTGASIVIEFVKGELRIHNNSVGSDNTGIGIMTNDPTWDWHLQNVNNYVSLQPTWAGGNNAGIRRVVPNESTYPWATNAYDSDRPMISEPIGHGYNLGHLPGDGSPPARFIRSFSLRGYAMQNAPP
eukprot:m.114701 g.114701  ORF g.114701 m.114701 type:complete len:329 (-) comp13060_c0_seq7:492-1478(-)